MRAEVTWYALRLIVGNSMVYCAGGAAGGLAGGAEAGAGAGEEEAVVAGIGAALPAVSEPRPSLLNESASIFPVGENPFLS